MTTAAISPGRWYPSPAPALDGESDDAYTDRLTGADRTGRRPYDHVRNRQCSIGWHSECSRTGCMCPCHSDRMTADEMGALPPEVRAAGAKLAELYDLPTATGYRVMAMTAERFNRQGLPDTAIKGGIAVDIAATYNSQTGDAFLTDVLSVYRAAAVGKLMA
jgi:hypothetical protein